MRILAGINAFSMGAPHEFQLDLGQTRARVAHDDAARRGVSAPLPAARAAAQVSQSPILRLLAAARGEGCSDRPVN